MLWNTDCLLSWFSKLALSFGFTGSVLRSTGHTVHIRRMTSFLLYIKPLEPVQPATTAASINGNRPYDNVVTWYSRHAKVIVNG